MKKAFPIIFALIIGLFLSKFMFNQYNYNSNISTVFKNSEELIFCMYGIYSSKDEMENSCSNLKSYIYSLDDEKYYVYLAITKNEENFNKLKGYFNRVGYDITRRTISISNNSYIDLLDQYDILLSKTNDDDVIEAIASQTITKYKEYQHD